MSRRQTIQPLVENVILQILRNPKLLKKILIGYAIAKGGSSLAQAAITGKPTGELWHADNRDLGFGEYKGPSSKVI